MVWSFGSFGLDNGVVSFENDGSEIDGNGFVLRLLEDDDKDSRVCAFFEQLGVVVVGPGVVDGPGVAAIFGLSWHCPSCSRPGSPLVAPEVLSRRFIVSR